MKTLVIAEKPSVAQDIVRALTPQAGKFEKHEEHFENAHYVVTSAIGHLLEIQAPDEFDVKRGKWSFANLPVIPPHFDIRPMDKTKARLNAIVKLARRKDVGSLVNACDAGREGELIFRLIQQYSKARHPVHRLWLQSMTPQAIREGFANLRSDEQMLPLADAARCRSEADWLVGINGTRAMTAFNSRDGGFFLTTVGRVQTPTLSIVVEREEAIRRFVSRDYWEVYASFQAQAGTYEGKWFDPQFKKAGSGQDADGASEPDPERKADRVWTQAQAQAIADAVRGNSATVTEESKPTTQASPLLFDLTSLQREANGRFGYSAKTTLSIAQSLYERHKALTYPRTDARALPEDYLPVVRQTFEMLAGSSMQHLAPHAAMALDKGYLRVSKRIFDNAKVSDHFAIIPTLQPPHGLSEAEQKIYDLVARRFMAVFFPSAEYLVTTRISRCAGHSFKTEGKVLVRPGWLAIYGKEAAQEPKDGEDRGAAHLVPVQAGEKVLVAHSSIKGLQTRPPPRYSEATLLGAMEGAGKTIEDDELRAAMHEKGLGTPATRASIIEGLIVEKYILREGRELIPTAKAFQLMTLLRGLGVEELSQAELTGEWEYKLAQMEHGKLSRASFMAEIAAMTERIVQKAKEYDRDTIPGDYATLHTPCPNCGGVVKENYRRYACTGQPGQAEGCGFSFGKTPGGRTFEVAEVEQLLRERRIGPLDGFRSKAGWPFTAELAIAFDEEAKNYKLEFDFGDDRAEQETGELVDFGAQDSLGACPKCGGAVYAHGRNYVCARSVPTAAQATPSCDFKTGQIILQQPVSREQMVKLLTQGKTDLLDKFVSVRTRRPFKAMLAWDAQAGKVGFEFAPSKFPPRKATGAARETPAAPRSTSGDAVAAPAAARRATKTGGTTKAAATGRARGAGATGAAADSIAARSAAEPTAKSASRRTAQSAIRPATKSAANPAAKSTGRSAAKSTARPARKAAAATGSGGTTRARAGTLRPSPELAAVIGGGPVARTEVVRKLWEYIKAQGLQDATDKRTISADARLAPVFGKSSITMFELAGLIGKHLH